MSESATNTESDQSTMSTQKENCVVKYFTKFTGADVARPPRATAVQTMWSFLGSFVGMSVLGLVSAYLVSPFLHLSVEAPPFGAMSVILFSAFKAPVAQPFNAIVGNTIGGAVGVAVVLVLQALNCEHVLWLGGALSVSLTIFVQEVTGSVHPPGGATALLYAYTPGLWKTKFAYILAPSFLGTVILVTLAVIMNNFSADRLYPQTWSNPYVRKPEKAANQKFELLSPTEMRDLKATESPEDGDASQGESAQSCSMLQNYFRKFAGADGAVEEPKPLSHTVYSVLGSFVGMTAIGLLHTYLLVPYSPMKLEVAAFGAMSVLLFSTWKAPLSQPLNTILGNTIGGVIGVLVVQVLELVGCVHLLWLGGALSVSLTIAVQEATGTVHPPGGATALLFFLNTGLHKMHVLFVFAPAFLGAVIMVSVAVITNNLASERVYPQRWL